MSARSESNGGSGERAAQPGPWRAEPPLARVGVGAGYGLDGQPLQTIARAVTADARQAGIDHGADARHRNRRLCHIGRQHDPLPRTALEDLALLFPTQARIQAQDLNLRLQLAFQHLADIANLALAGKKNQDIAVADISRFASDLLAGLENRRG